MSLPTVNTQRRTADAVLAPAAPAQIGPNSVIQTLAALKELEGTATRDRVARLAGLPATEPTGMIPEAAFSSLLSSLRRELDEDTVREVLVQSGEKTGDYVAANRIPAPLRSLFGWLPARMSIPLLLVAFRRHAWTFAGNSSFELGGTYPGSILLDNAPTCRLAGAVNPTGGYYAAAFQRLLSLASPGVLVTETECRSCGAPHCRFDIHLTDHSSNNSSKKELSSHRPRG